MYDNGGVALAPDGAADTVAGVGGKGDEGEGKSKNLPITRSLQFVFTDIF